MDTAPLSLYFDIPENENADLEVVARAALEWSALVREVASIVAPDLEFEIELIQTQEGSLWLQNVLRAVKDGDRKALATIAFTVLGFFALGPALHLQAQFGKEFWKLFGVEDTVELSEQERNAIIDGVAKVIEKDRAESRRRNVIIQVEQDPTIRGVGVGLTPRKEGPIAKIERDDFPFYAAKIEGKNEITTKGTDIRTSVRVTIIRANLDEGERKPRWRFKEGETKWSADIEDEGFVLALNLQSTGIPLAVGQSMVIDLAIDKKWADGAWEETNRRITYVHSPAVIRQQGELVLGRKQLPNDKE